MLRYCIKTMKRFEIQNLFRLLRYWICSFSSETYNNDQLQSTGSVFFHPLSRKTAFICHIRVSVAPLPPTHKIKNILYSNIYTENELTWHPRRSHNSVKALLPSPLSPTINHQSPYISIWSIPWRESPSYCVVIANEGIFYDTTPRASLYRYAINNCNVILYAFQPKWNPATKTVAKKAPDGDDDVGGRCDGEINVQKLKW